MYHRAWAKRGCVRWCEFVMLPFHLVWQVPALVAALITAVLLGVVNLGVQRPSQQTPKIGALKKITLVSARPAFALGLVEVARSFFTRPLALTFSCRRPL